MTVNLAKINQLKATKRKNINSLISLLALTLTSSLGICKVAKAGTFHLDSPLAARTVMTTVDDPNNHIITASDYSGFFNGVTKLLINKSNGSFICSGALITESMVLTAAHCLTDSEGNLNTNSLTATFDINSFNGIGYYVHANWQGDKTTASLFAGADIAIVELDRAVDSSINRYKISTSLSAYFDRAGYGKHGTGDTGATAYDGKLRLGQNVYELLYDTYLLGYDFDNGTATNNTINLLGYMSDTGLPGAKETLAASGDSGGPTFDVDGNIIGVSSFVAQYGVGDIDATLNSSYGEVGYDTIAYSYSDWLGAIAGASIFVSVPEASVNFALLAIGIGIYLTGKKSNP